MAESVERLDEWLDANSWVGYDPYDILGREPFLAFESFRTRHSSLRGPLYAAILIPSLFPHATRRLLRVKKTANAKAAALLARSYLNLYEINKQQRHMTRALTLLRWLVSNPSRGYKHLCWGYPFDWQSHVFLPAGTPSAIVTCVAAQSLLHGYTVTQEEWLLDAANDCCQFLTGSLTRFEDERGICFSYTPLDDFRVHNANLMVACTLGLVADMMHLQEYYELARKAVGFSLGDQTDKGAFFYWDSRYARTHALSNWIDSLHTGYVIESLAILARILHEAEVARATRKSLEFYEANLFVGGSAPVPRLGDRINPLVVDIHDCAEAILVFARLFHLGFAPSVDRAFRVAKWTIRSMQDSEGFFHRAIYRWGRDTFPYIRWSQAWMLYALSELMKAMSSRGANFTQNASATE